MTEEEYFRENYPDSCYGDKPLSPHWDFFQDGVEFGERQSEKKIEELEKENADLKCECRRCVYSDRFCIVSDYGKDRNGICDHFKDVFDENVELKEELNYAESHCLFHSDCPVQKENAELKEKQKWLGRSTKCWFTDSPCRSCDEHDERLRRLGLCYIGQLTKAKNILNNFLNACEDYEISEARAEAEQFISEMK